MDRSASIAAYQALAASGGVRGMIALSELAALDSQDRTVTNRAAERIAR